MNNSKAPEHQIHKRGSTISIILLIIIALILSAVIYLLFQPGTEEDSSMRTILLSIVAIIVAGLIWYLVWEFSAANRLRRRLKKIVPLVDSEPMEEVKKMYLKIYDLYMKLPEKKKQNFYARVNSLRESIEEHLQKEKELERLLKDTEKGSIKELEKKYLEIFAIYEKLPQNVQNQYYPQVVQLRDRLERGK